MGRTKVAKQKANSTKADIAELPVAASTSAASPGHSASDLLDRAEANLASGQADGIDLARKFAERASEILAQNGEHDAIQQARAGEVLGMCALEDGDEDEAREVGHDRNDQVTSVAKPNDRYLLPSQACRPPRCSI